MKPKDNFWNQEAPRLRDAEHYERIEEIRDIVNANISTDRCPEWSYKYSPCETCERLFPRIKKEFCSIANVCPCSSSYTKTHLVRVLNLVLRQNKHLKWEE